MSRRAMSTADSNTVGQRGILDTVAELSWIRVAAVMSAKPGLVVLLSYRTYATVIVLGCGPVGYCCRAELDLGCSSDVGKSWSGNRYSSGVWAAIK